jgi:hypothetical protein
LRFPTLEEIEAAKRVVEIRLSIIPKHIRSIKNLETGIPNLYANVGPEKSIKIFYSEEKLKTQFNF